MDNFSLFYANAVLAVVVSLAFLVAGKARGESFWLSWGLANGVIALALVAFMFETELPDWFVVTVPNGLLVLGISLKWLGARRFERRAPIPGMLVGPAALFVVIAMMPWIYGSYGAVYTVVNVLLTALTIATAREFWRAEEEGLSASRYGIVFAYGLLALSFAIRVGQGLVAGADMARQIPDDLLLVIHLTIALFHLAGSGVFALSLAYERDAARLRWMATRDTLTSLLNRAAFEERVSARLADGSEDAAILMIDMDHFKQINDVHGHAAGDEALKTCAAVLLDCLGTEALVARWGGEEFAAMLPGVSADEARALAERLRHQIGLAELGPVSNRFSASVSVGICHTTTGLRQFDLLLRQADAALYAAKANGRNRAEMAAA